MAFHHKTTFFKTKKNTKKLCEEEKNYEKKMLLFHKFKKNPRGTKLKNLNSYKKFMTTQKLSF